MSDTRVHHATFTLTRDLDAPAARVWGAFARQDLKARWLGAQHSDVAVFERSMDFRPGGRERVIGNWKSGLVTDFQCHYFDILEGARITYVYEMFVNGWKMSVSLATIQVEARGAATRLTITEQGAFFGDDGAKNAAGREQGTAGLLDILGANLDD
jgi:uncharacterized protein YndB with AHSA1/START domain